MKNILSKIYIHPFTCVFIVISLVTGLFKELITFIWIIFVHEMGHVFASQLYKWKIEKIQIMPFGGITIFNEYINRPLKEEFVILIMGPLFQLINYLIFRNITPYFNYYNYGLFLFNMLPIYPLDGYKLYIIFLYKLIPFKMCLYISLITSFILIVVFFRFQLIYVIIALLLAIGTIKEYRNINFTFNKFLYERYNFKFHFKKKKIINKIDNMYKDCYHIFRKDRYMTEEEVLRKRYDK